MREEEGNGVHHCCQWPLHLLVPIVNRLGGNKLYLVEGLEVLYRKVENYEILL